MIVQVQAWMGHADVKTTMRYLHHKGQADEAALLAGAFRAQAHTGLEQPCKSAPSAAGDSTGTARRRHVRLRQVDS